MVRFMIVAGICWAAQLGSALGVGFGVAILEVHRLLAEEMRNY